tara:strand:- start:499 stop:1005 length:507 start_codon:yes stop_codon:yes gene_type:complete
MKSFKEIRNESKQKDIADLRALLKNPDPKVTKNYGGIDGYKKMIQSKIDKLIKEETENLDEALTRAQRIKRSQIAKRNKAKIQRALQKGKKKRASTETLQKRAKKKARDLLYTKLLKGRNRADVSAGEQERIEKKLDKMQGGINRIAKKLLPQLKKAEQEKLKKKSNK